MSKPKKMSAAEVRRRRAVREQQEAAGPPPLLPQHEKSLAEFVPRTVTAQEFVLIRPRLEVIMRRSGIIGASTFPQHLSDVTLFLAYALRQDHSLELCHVLDHRLIEEWARADLADLEATTRSTRRSRLRSLASKLNPGPAAPPRGVRVPKSTVKPPYSIPDVGSVIRLATTQPSARISQQLCAMVGLGLGAGLDSSDLRDLRVSDIDDRGEEGLWVSIRGNRPRLVVVRAGYEDLVRAGLEGLSAHGLLLGRDAHRRNITAHIVGNAVTLGTAVHIEQTRLRSTWLTELMCAPIPLAVVLSAAGLVSARTLIELLPHAVARQAERDLTGPVL